MSPGKDRNGGLLLVGMVDLYGGWMDSCRASSAALARGTSRDYIGAAGRYREKGEFCGGC